MLGELFWLRAKKAHPTSLFIGMFQNKALVKTLPRAYNTVLAQGMVLCVRLIMPVYTYQCENCGVRFEHTAKFVDPPLTVCPDCGKTSLRKIYQPVGIVFKGSGFYSTDHRSPSGASKFGNHDSKSSESKSGDESSSSSSSSPDSASSTSPSSSSSSSSSSNASSSSSASNSTSSESGKSASKSEK
jgi:putative FmdB family regulatory protein